MPKRDLGQVVAYVILGLVIGFVLSLAVEAYVRSCPSLYSTPRPTLSPLVPSASPA